MARSHASETDDAAHTRSGKAKRRPIEKTAEEARQGEIVLGRRARWTLLACIVLFLLAALILGPWW